jgi:hypothetical protein
MMQYSRTDTYNAVCKLARHMTSATQVYYDAMLRMMKYVDDTSIRGLVLNPTQKWNENKEHESLSVVEVIPTMQKIRRCKRPYPDTGCTFGRCNCYVQEFNAEVCCTISL